MNENAFRKLGKLIIVSIIEIGIIVLLSTLIPNIDVPNYLQWVIYSAVTVAVCAFIVGGITLIFYKPEFKQLLGYVNKLILKRK